VHPGGVLSFWPAGGATAGNAASARSTEVRFPCVCASPALVSASCVVILRVRGDASICDDARRRGGGGGNTRDPEVDSDGCSAGGSAGDDSTMDEEEDEEAGDDEPAGCGVGEVTSSSMSASSCSTQRAADQRESSGFRFGFLNSSELSVSS